MPIVTLSELRDTVPRGKRLMGLDLGSKTIGLALSDGTFRIASPLVTLARKKFTADALALKALIDEHGVGGLVLGLPINMDGTEGPRCQSTRQFAANLLGKFDIPIAFHDERLSTAAVERVLIGEADMTRKRRGEVVDKMAAAWILQGALDIAARPPRVGEG
jgi:putative Holliday junction resolvase